MRTYILYNLSLTHYLIFGSLLLGILRIMLSSYDVVETSDPLSEVIKYVAGAMLLAGIILRQYQAKRLGNFRSLMIRIAIGVAIVIVMLLAQFIHTPFFLSDIF